MAKIEQKITYKGHICTLESTINGLCFYSYEGARSDNGEADILVITKKGSEEVLAVVEPVLRNGAYGLYFDKYDITKE